MVIKQKQEFHYGSNAITEEFGKYSNMMMDFGILRLAKAQSEALFSETKEIAVLLLQGEVVLEWEGNRITSYNVCYTKLLRGKPVFC